MSICEYLEIIRQTPCVSCLYDPAFLLRNNYPIKHETYGQNINAYARKIYLKSEMIFGIGCNLSYCNQFKNTRKMKEARTFDL